MGENNKKEMDIINSDDKKNILTTDVVQTDPIMEQELKEDFLSSINICYDKINRVKNEVSKVILGQDEIIYSVIRSMICQGHILLEGLPGLGKTVLCKTIATVSSLNFKRVQFTTDLLPSDIIGITTYDKDRGFEVIKGPIFSNLMLADEINRAPPKVQSALLEAMGEGQVTIGKESHRLKQPFLVLATQNPIEQAGTFPLPEAQLDRFLFKIVVGYPEFDAEYNIMESNLNNKKMQEFELGQIMDTTDILALQGIIKKIHIEKRLKEYILNIVRATRNPFEFNVKHASLLQVGGSPRASINLLKAAKCQALIKGRYYVVPQDVKTIVHAVLRHRLQLTFQAKIDNIDSDNIIDEILDKVQIY